MAGFSVQLQLSSILHTMGMTVWCDSAPSVLENPSFLYAKCIVLEIINNQTVKLREIAEPGKEVLLLLLPCCSCFPAALP
ncbi:hypothetical protein ENH_00008730 [Eimeria necatrix]|uniref:Uncharacterized protein n=1 Tax=Eimeria necatrix TaxID=51315 RepID=U6MIG0_9EIME|nr:hypothetical protein ENH_00008730 [Eimeria necatrix]CDJ62239.1 hypothetical protein ENH_00008730 [Eimeria necatrix]